MIVKAPDMEMPPFKMYYPSMEDMDQSQRAYFQYWIKELNEGNPRTADASYIYVHIYDLIKRGVKNISDSPSIINELRKIRDLYPDQVGLAISQWMSDLALHSENFALAYQFIQERFEKENYVSDINKLLNLKHRLSIPIDGKDLFFISKKVGHQQSSLVRNRPKEAYEIAQNILDDFQKESGYSLFSYIQLDYPLIKKADYLFSGIAMSRTDSINQIDFLTSYHLLKFSIETIEKVEAELKGKYGRRTTKTKKKVAVNNIGQNLWEARIKSPFVNPNPNMDGGCLHVALRLVNESEVFRKYACTECRKIFMCSSDRRLAEATRDYQIKGEWLDGICPKCRGLDDTSFMTRGKLMYGSTFYAKHWREIAFEVCEMIVAGKIKNSLEENARKTAENTLRAKYGIPLIGEGWVSETTLYKSLKDIFSEYEVIHHGKAPWLGLMHLDVYIPELKIAFEYQGKQHHQPVEHFGGQESFEATQKRDARKAELCKENGVELFYINDGDDFSEGTLTKMLSNYLN